MRAKIDRRRFATSSAGLLAAGCTALPGLSGQQARVARLQEEDIQNHENKPAVPVESPFERDYDAPGFQPSWKNPQINRTMAADFVIYAHSDLDMTRMLLEREPGLLNAAVDWGAGDYETALGGASHMGRKDIVRFLLGRGARIDIFCAAMMGMLATVKEMLTIEPRLIDARGPHGFSLHFHAQVGQEDAKPVLDYLQSVKEVELRDIPFLRKKPPAKTGQQDQL
jgi:hypothetical protein